MAAVTICSDLTSIISIRCYLKYSNILRYWGLELQHIDLGGDIIQPLTPKECTIALISHTSKVMLKILQAKLQQYVKWELPDIQAGFRKGRRTRDQIANIHWIIEKAREFQKNIYFWFIDYAKAFDYVYHNKLWKILKEVGIPDHLNFLLRNLYADQEATVRTRHGTTESFQIGKGVRQGCILSSYWFNLYAEYIMQNAGLDEAQRRLPGEISITSDMQMTPPLWQKVKKN